MVSYAVLDGSLEGNICWESCQCNGQEDVKHAANLGEAQTTSLGHAAITVNTPSPKAVSKIRNH